VRRKDLAATTVLLEHKADPHIADHEGFSPIHNAAIAGCKEVTDALLANGADPGIWNALQGHPLRIATWYHNDPRCIQPFIGPNVNIDDNTVGTGATALHRSAVYGHEHGVSCLVKNGANINVKSKVGEPAIFRCFGGDNVAALKMFLDLGADYVGTLPDGNTILHIAAGSSRSPEIISVLELHGLAGFDPLAKNKEGETPLNVLERSEPPVDFKEAFERLVDSLSHRTTHQFRKELLDLEAKRLLVLDLDGDEAKSVDGSVYFDCADN
jgi:ankyrin repeat protein